MYLFTFRITPTCHIAFIRTAVYVRKTDGLYAIVVRYFSGKFYQAYIVRWF